jgi:hypothetical protein
MITVREAIAMLIGIFVGAGHAYIYARDKYKPKRDSLGRFQKRKEPIDFSKVGA